MIKGEYEEVQAVYVGENVLLEDLGRDKGRSELKQALEDNRKDQILSANAVHDLRIGLIGDIIQGGDEKFGDVPRPHLESQDEGRLGDFESLDQIPHKLNVSRLYRKRQANIANNLPFTVDQKSNEVEMAEFAGSADQEPATSGVEFGSSEQSKLQGRLESDDTSTNTKTRESSRVREVHSKVGHLLFEPEGGEDVPCDSRELSELVEVEVALVLQVELVEHGLLFQDILTRSDNAELDTGVYKGLLIGGIRANELCQVEEARGDALGGEVRPAVGLATHAKVVLV